MVKLKPEIIDEIIASFERTGPEAYLDELARRDPPTYCKLLAHVLPKAVNVEVQGSEPIDLGRAILEANKRLATSRVPNDQR